MKKLLVSGIAVAVVLGASATLALAAGGGFNSYGYNWTANVFQGTLQQWCNKLGVTDSTICGGYGFGSANDLLTMKWNAEWDRGIKQNWSQPPYDAWENNEWNGDVPGGDGYVWHYNIVWTSACSGQPDGTYLANGGYCIWGQFEVLMDQGTDPTNTHTFYALGLPTGYGAYFSQ